MSDLLELILEYKMTKPEAKAFKIAIMYTELLKKYFPEYANHTLGRSDPRKTILFKHCYKLLQECPLQDHEYRLYLTAQFQVLKNINYGTGDAFVSPSCITGEKAWTRWLFWKSRFQRIQDRPEPPQVNANVVIRNITKTKEFLQGKFSKLTRKDIYDNMENVFKWCVLGEISGHYLALSPIVSYWLEERKIDLLDRFSIDLKHFRNDLTKEVELYFKKEFGHEFV